MGDNWTLEKHWLSLVKVLNVTKDFFGHFIGSSLIENLNALPLKGSLNLVMRTLLEVQDLVVLETQRTPLAVKPLAVVQGQIFGLFVTYDATRGMCVFR